MNNPVDTITLSKSGTTFTVNFKKNGANVSGLNLEGGILKLSNPDMSETFQSTDVTNSSGNITKTYTFISSFHGTAYVTFAGVTSNTLTY